MIKYIILDFGKVIAGPKTGNWNITSKLLELVDIDKDKFIDSCRKYNYILKDKITTLDEEYNMFIKFYKNVFSECNYICSEDIIKEIANSRVYDKYRYVLYDNVVDELKVLKDKYKLILLTDNWPSVLLFLKDWNIDVLFDKIYISSIYGVEKRDKTLFDYPINDFNISSGEAIFIDDNEKLLDIAKEKELDVLLMDRENKVDKSKYKIIHDLNLEDI